MSRKTNKTILILAIAGAFMVGTFLPNTVEALEPFVKEKSLKGPVLAALNILVGEINSLDSRITPLESKLPGDINARVTALENQEFRMATTVEDMTFRLIGPGERVSFGLRCDDPDATAIGGGFTVTGQGPNPENVIVQELNSPRPDNSFNKYIAVIENNGLDDAVIEGFVTCGTIVKIP